MLKRNLTTITILAVLLSSGAAMADKGGNNGLHEGQERQEGQQNWQQKREQGEDSRSENMLRHPQQNNQQLKRDQHQFKKFIKKPLKQISK